MGLDSSPAMLRRARGLPSSWELIVADAIATPFAQSTFDVVTCCYLLHLLAQDERAQVIAECRRMLRQSGRLVTVTVPIFQTLAPLDPRPEIEAAGFTIERSRFVSLGYLSLCVLAQLPDPGCRYQRLGKGKGREVKIKP